MPARRRKRRSPLRRWLQRLRPAPVDPRTLFPRGLALRWRLPTLLLGCVGLLAALLLDAQAAARLHTPEWLAPQPRQVDPGVVVLAAVSLFAVLSPLLFAWLPRLTCAVYPLLLAAGGIALLILGKHPVGSLLLLAAALEPFVTALAGDALAHHRLARSSPARRS